MNCKPASNKEIRAMFNRLVEEDGILVPVKLRIVKEVPREGCADFGGNEKDGFVIRIEKGMCHTCARDALLHEWAHLRVRVKHGLDERDHGPWWGREHARLYRIYVKTE